MSTRISPEITEASPWWISRERYYERYRKFFWILDKLRD